MAKSIPELEREPKLRPAVEEALAALLQESDELVDGMEYDHFDEESSFMSGNFGEARRAERRNEDKGREWESVQEKIHHLTKPRKARDEAQLLEWVRQSPDGELVVYALLREDCWETRFGDGYYAYFSAAYLDLEAAETWARIRDKAEQGTKHHIITAQLRASSDGDGAGFEMTAQKSGRDRLSVYDLVEGVTLTGAEDTD